MTKKWVGAVDPSEVCKGLAKNKGFDIEKLLDDAPDGELMSCSEDNSSEPTTGVPIENSQQISLQHIDNSVKICSNNAEAIFMINTKSTANVKMNADVKELAAQILARMGIDQTTAIRAH